jgi:hypothetical protein
MCSFQVHIHFKHTWAHFRYTWQHLRYIIHFMFFFFKFSLYRLWRPLGLWEVKAPTFSDIRLIGGGKVVSPTRRPLFTPRKIPGNSFLLEAESTPRAIVQLEGLGKLKKSTSPRTRTGDLPACSIMPRPTTLLCAPTFHVYTAHFGYTSYISTKHGSSEVHMAHFNYVSYTSCTHRTSQIQVIHFRCIPHISRTHCIFQVCMIHFWCCLCNCCFTYNIFKYRNDTLPARSLPEFQWCLLQSWWIILGVRAPTTETAHVPHLFCHYQLNQPGKI